MALMVRAHGQFLNRYDWVLIYFLKYFIKFFRREPDGKSYIKYQVIGANTVAVPTHFYKVVVAEAPDGSLDMEAYVMPNQKIPDDTPVSSFMVNIYISLASHCIWQIAQ